MCYKLLFIFILLFQLCFAQLKQYSVSNFDFISTIDEYNNKLISVSTNYDDYNCTQFSKQTFIVTDTSLNEIRRKTLEPDSGRILLGNILYKNDTLITFAYTESTTTNKKYLNCLKLDWNLNILSNNAIRLNDTIYQFSPQIQYYNNQYYISGFFRLNYCTPDPNLPDQLKGVLIKFDNENFDNFKQKIIWGATNNSYVIFYNKIIRNNSIYLLGHKDMWKYDLDLNLKTYLPQNVTNGMLGQGGFVEQNDKIYFNTASFQSRFPLQGYSKLCIGKTDTTLQIATNESTLNCIGVQDTDSYAANTESVALLSNNKIALCGFIGGGYLFDIQPNTYISYTFVDTFLNTISTHRYGGDRFYSTTGIKKLNSGNLLIYGNINAEDNIVTGEKNVDAFLLKLDANGNTITHTQSPENPSINIYPNPFTDHIFIENTPAISNIQIIDNTGKILFIADKLLSNTILTSHFSKGFYILKYQYKNNMFTQKMLKQ